MAVGMGAEREVERVVEREVVREEGKVVAAAAEVGGEMVEDLVVEKEELGALQVWEAGVGAAAGMVRMGTEGPVAVVMVGGTVVRYTSPAAA